jgi:peptidoglycan/LPS O-acetylase OafA/YrhL
MLKRQEFWALNWLRFFLSLYIVLFHTLNHQYKLVKTHPVISALLDLGNFATSVFFVLSGFLLTYVYVSLRDNKKIDGRSFIVSRLSALYPIHIFTSVLALPFFLSLIYRNGGIAIPLDALTTETRLLGNCEMFFALLMNLTLTHAWNPLYLLLNPPTWSLSALLFFYLLFPFFAPWLNKIRKPITGLVILGVLFSMPAAFAQMAGLSDIVTDGVLHRNPIVRLPLFLGGILLCVIYARRTLTLTEKLSKMTAVGLFFLVIATIAVAAYAQVNYSGPQTHLVRNGLYYPASLAVVWMFANVGQTVSKWNQQWSARLGKASLSIFALHYPMFDIVRRGEKLLRACIMTWGEDRTLSSLFRLAKTLDETILMYPVYLFLVIFTSIALQEQIVNPLQLLIKKRYFMWNAKRAQVFKIEQAEVFISRK